MSFEPPVDPRFGADDAASAATPVRPERLDEADQTVLRPRDELQEPRTIRKRRPLPTTPPSAQVFAGRPIDRYQAPVEEIEVVKKPIPVSRIVMGIVAVVVLAVVAGFVYVRYFYKPGVDIGTVVPGGGQTTEVQVQRADEVVRRYLQALRDGDVEAALQYGPPAGQGSHVLLNNAAYDRSRLTHAISDIRVPNVDTNTNEVTASYKLGDQDVTSRFRMRKTDEGNWQLAHTTITVRFDAPNATNVPLIINGIEVSATNPVFELLPGFYTVETGLPFVTYPESNGVLLSNLEYDGTAVRTLNPTLTDRGIQAMINLARNSLSYCMSQASLNPPNCPNRVQALQPVNASTITWQLLGDPFSNARPALNSSEMSRAEMSMTLQFMPNWVYADGSTPGRLTTEPVSANLSASLLVRSEDELRAIWRI